MTRQAARWSARCRKFRLVAVGLLVLSVACIGGKTDAARAQGITQAQATSQGGQGDQADPAQIERRIREQERQEPRPDPDLGLPATPQRPGPPAEAPDSFVLAAVAIEGASVFEGADFGLLYEEFLAREITLNEVEEILARITRRYRDEGYILSRAIAPPQDLESGVLQVQVVEGFIEAVIFDGVEPDDWDLDPYAEHLTAARPLELAQLERTILLINDLAGLSVSPSLRAIDEDAGSYELILALEPDRLDGAIYVDNRGTPDVGRLQSWQSLGVNSAFGTAERFQLGLFTVPNQPQELIFLEGTYDQPIGSDGTAATLVVSGSRVEPGGEFEPIDTKSHSRAVTLRLRHPVIRSRELNLWLTGSFDYRNLREERFAAETLDDRLRVVRGRVNVSVADDLEGANFLSLEASRGLDILGASRPGDPTRSRFDGEVEFTKVTGQAARQQALPFDFSLQVSVSGQYSFDPLLSAEEFALGGSQFGRAYDFSEITGEHGIAGSLELAYAPPLELDWASDAQVYGFYDTGFLWNDLPGDGTTRDSVSSAGGGLRLTLFDDVQAGVEVAVPLTRRVFTRNSDAPRVFFFVSAGL